MAQWLVISNDILANSAAIPVDSIRKLEVDEERGTTRLLARTHTGVGNEVLAVESGPDARDKIRHLLLSVASLLTHKSPLVEVVCSTLTIDNEIRYSYTLNAYADHEAVKVKGKSQILKVVPK